MSNLYDLPPGLQYQPPQWSPHVHCSLLSPSIHSATVKGILSPLSKIPQYVSIAPDKQNPCFLADMEPPLPWAEKALPPSRASAPTSCHSSPVLSHAEQLWFPGCLFCPGVCLMLAPLPVMLPGIAEYIFAKGITCILLIFKIQLKYYVIYEAFSNLLTIPYITSSALLWIYSLPFF